MLNDQSIFRFSILITHTLLTFRALINFIPEGITEATISIIEIQKN